MAVNVKVTKKLNDEKEYLKVRVKNGFRYYLVVFF